tara:strand:+ start:6980 stop:7339 length:360 start_codon:yes stop_codon:yes gene_type:complete
MRSLHSLTLIRVVSLLCIPFALQGDQNAPPWENTTKVGRALYRENCIVCHDIEKRETQKLGPSLFRLFQNETLPFSGGEPNVPYVKIKIQFGGDVMPPYVDRLTAEEIETIISYIKKQH